MFIAGGYLARGAADTIWSAPQVLRAVVNAGTSHIEALEGTITLWKGKGQGREREREGGRGREREGGGEREREGEGGRERGGGEADREGRGCDLMTSIQHKRMSTKRSRRESEGLLNNECTKMVLIYVQYSV